MPCIKVSRDSNLRCLHLRRCLNLGAYPQGREVDLQRFPLPDGRRRLQLQLPRTVSEYGLTSREYVPVMSPITVLLESVWVM